MQKITEESWEKEEKRKPHASSWITKRESWESVAFLEIAEQKVVDSVNLSVCKG